VWQVKWELEDLAFRYLQPAEYRHIAAALKVRRTARELYIEELKSRLERELRAAGIEARIDEMAANGTLTRGSSEPLPAFRAVKVAGAPVSGTILAGRADRV